MAFNSIQFLLFLPVVYLVFLLTRDAWRWVVLLLASALFYAALGTPYLLLVLALVTLTGYAFGRWLGAARLSWRKPIFIGGLGVLLLILIGMKYLPFLTGNLNALLKTANLHPLPVPAELISIGVSFYVFQAAAYLINIYLELVEPEKHAGYFALYQSFFPKLLQGPIEKPEALLPQLRQPFIFNYENTRAGLLRFGWGLFKKIILADRLGILVNAVYNHAAAFNGWELALATLAFAFQIYFDFSAYTDMALGVACLFNIRLTENFDKPYLARSIADFWRRWHITFSRWILDYIFKPLQMVWRRATNWGSAAALVVTFLISGLWHGAQWTFIIWGLLHGLYMAISVFYTPWRKKLYKKLRLEKNPLARAWQVLLTFSLVTFAWIFFRANNLADAATIIGHIFTWLESLARFTVKSLVWLPLRGQGNLGQFFQKLPEYFSLDSQALLLQPEDWLLVGVGLAVYLLVSSGWSRFRFFSRPQWMRWVVYYLLTGSVLFGAWRLIVIYADIYKDVQFLYFRF